MRVSVGAMLDYVWLSGVAHSVILVSKLPKKKNENIISRNTLTTLFESQRGCIYIFIYI